MAPPLPAPAWVAKLYSNSELLTKTPAPVTEMPPPFWAVLLMKVVPTTVVVTAVGSVTVEMPWLLVITIAPPSPPAACADQLVCLSATLAIVASDEGARSSSFLFLGEGMRRLACNGLPATMGVPCQHSDRDSSVAGRLTTPLAK